MPDNFILGMNAKTYYSTTLATADTAAHFAGLSWTELDNIRDAGLNAETGESDITTRANNGWRATAATLKDGSIETEMVWKPSDAGFAAIKDAWLNGTEIAIAIMDGDVSTPGNQGLAGNFTVTNFSRDEPLEEAIKVNVTLKPSSFNNWWVVTT